MIRMRGFVNMGKKKVLMIVVISAILMGIYLLFNRNYLSFGLFKADYSIESVNEVTIAENGNKYFIDSGSTKVIRLNSDDEIVTCYKGGNEKAAFYYATHVCETDEGTIYVSDIVYGNHGNQIEQERIFKFVGFKKTCIMTYDYTNEENPPLQYGNILELRYEDGQVYYTYKTLDGNISVYSISKDDMVECLHTYYVPKDCGISDASYDSTSDFLVLSDRRGNVYYSKKDESELSEAYMGVDDALVPDTFTKAGNGYFYDTNSQSIYKLDGKTFEFSKVYEDENIYAQLSMDENGNVYATDRELAYVLSMEDGAVEKCYGEVNFEKPVRLGLCWLFLILTALCVLVAIVIIILYINDYIEKSDDNGYGLRMLEITSACIIVSVFVTYSMVQAVTDDKATTMMRDLEMFTSVMNSFVDPEEVSDIESISDYNSPEYKALKNMLDSAVEESYKVEKYYYYDILIPNYEQQTFEVIMDYENAYLCTTPVYPMGDNEYSQSFENKEMVSIDGGMSSYGSWSYCLHPIVNSDGEAIGLLEVGMNSDHVRSVIRQFTIDSIIDVFCASTVIAMLILEILFLARFYDAKKRKVREYEGIEIPIRMLVFLVYMADSMQDGFVALLCANLYESSVGSFIQMLPKGVAIALPMSAQLFVSAVSTLIGGKYVDKEGTKKMLILGFLSSVAGFAICGVGQTYSMILIGKCIIGLGQGFVYVVANAAAGMGSNDDSCAKGFSDVSAGVLSGVTSGVGLGTVALTLGSYHLVYIIGAVAMIPGLWISIRSKERIAEPAVLEANGGEEEVGEIGLKEFFFSREVWTFFFLLLTPFMIGLSFRDYFFPLYVEQFGVTEIRIGQFYLLCGMAVLYIGPSLANLVIKKCGAFGCSLFASICLALSIGVFAVFPSELTAFFSVAAFYVTICFAYTCQYFSFENMKTVKRYEIGKAMGIYSMFENVGQTLGPIIFGAFAILGLVQSVTAFLGIYIVLIVLFILINIRRKKNDDRVSETD